MEPLLAPVAAWLASTNLDEVLGFVSSAVALLGVPFALVQAWRARTAAEAARDATVALRRRQALLDAVGSLAGCVSKLDDLPDRLADGELAAGAGVIRSVRRELAELGRYRASLAADERALLQGAVTALRELQVALSLVPVAPLDQDQVRALGRRLLDHTDELHGLLTMLRGRAAGDEDDA